MSNLQNIAFFESQTEALEEKIDEVIKKPDMIETLVENYTRSDIHLMLRLIRQRTDMDTRTRNHLVSLFNLAESIRGSFKNV